MTNKDLLIQLLCEATHESKALVTMKVHFVMRWMEEEKAGSTAGFDKDLSENDAQIVLNSMRQQQAQIVEWFTWRLYLAGQL